jgi:hypothetical protein
MKQFKSFEDKIIKIIVDVLHRFTAVFEDIGITYEHPKIEVWKSSPDDYESEFRVSFFKNGKFKDIIECHIFRGSKQIAEIDEFQSWIEEAVEDLIKSMKS